MRRGLLLTPLILLASTGCHRAPVAAAPIPETPAADLAALARADSLEAARRAREDSLARAKAESERLGAEEEARRLARVQLALADTLAQRVHFAFDRSDLRPGDMPLMERKLALLRANPSLTIRIVGHCDERGSDEYNLALGNRRAAAARQYLISHGIAAARLTTFSYGEERPLMSGHDEGAWEANRRDEFEPVEGADALMAPMASR